jgi:hypothetical protein
VDIREIFELSSAIHNINGLPNIVLADLYIYISVEEVAKALIKVDEKGYFT